MSRTLIMTIVRLLIVSLITLNVAWATDNCALTGCADESGQFTVISDDSAPAGQSTPGPDCDNWCNACVSHVALPSIFSPNNYLPAVNGGIFVNDRYSSLAASPPIHPPIA